METDRASNLVDDSWALICSCPNGTEGQKVKTRSPPYSIRYYLTGEENIKKLNKHQNQEKY